MKYASDRLKNDIEVALVALKNQFKYSKKMQILNSISDTLKNNKKFMLEMVKIKGQALKYASNELKNDKELVIEAVKSNKGIFKDPILEYASDELRSDQEVIFEALRMDEKALKYVKNIRFTKQFMLEAIKINGLAIWKASTKLRADKEFVIEAVKNNGEALKYASDELKNDPELIELSKNNEAS